MPESTQHVLGRIRPPRVQITYDVEVGNAIEKKELPFVVGILADLAGKTNKSLPALKERKFTAIDRDNFNEIMAALEPRLAFQVESTLSGEGEKLGVEIIFKNMDDFNPAQVAKQIPLLNALYQSRVRLIDLVSKLDGNEALDNTLLDIVSSPDRVASLKGEAESEGGETPELDKIIEEGKLARDPIQLGNAREILKEFIRQITAHEGAAPQDIYAFIMSGVKRIDEALSAQLDEILHHEDFQKLEGSWRGLHYLVMNSETSTRLKLRLLNISRKELVNDLEKAVEFDQSQLFKKIYEEEYGTFGGHPFSCFVGDYSFGRNPQDVEILMRLSNIAASAHTPFLAAVNPHLFDMDSFAELSAPRDLAKLFESTELIKWNSFRETEDSRYISLLMPRVLMRQPYGSKTIPVDAFNYEEKVDGETNGKFCWGNPAYILAERITKAFALYGWTAAIRGVEGGGLVENLPVYTFKTDRGDTNMKCPTEVTITDRREKELSDLGFIPLCHCKGKDYAAFFGGQTTQKPKVYNLDDANANAEISARLPYILNASRFAHYIKAIMRDKIGSFMSRQEVALYLQNWIAQYILLSDFGSNNVKARYPLREARIDVMDVPGKPGAYKAVIFLRPHFQLEELTASLRLVANLPPSAA